MDFYSIDVVFPDVFFFIFKQLELHTFSWANIATTAYARASAPTWMDGPSIFLLRNDDTLIFLESIFLQQILSRQHYNITETTTLNFAQLPQQNT